MKAITVFLGASHGNDPAYSECAREVGRSLAQRGITLVYGGGRVGLMGQLADAALAAGGQVIGVIPHFLADKEVAHTGLTELHLVETMHERKAMMAQLTDAFVALPGGFGTLDELCEILTWAQLKLHNKPIALLNLDGYYDNLIQFFKGATASGLLAPQYLELLLIATQSSQVLDLLDRHRAAAPIADTDKI